jgi:hypothetical protein
VRSDLLVASFDLPIKPPNPVVGPLLASPVFVVLVDPFPPLDPVKVGVCSLAEFPVVLAVRDVFHEDEPVDCFSIAVLANRSLECTVPDFGALLFLPT